VSLNTTNHSTLNLLGVLSLVFSVRVLARDLSQSLCHFIHHRIYSSCEVSNSHTKSSWHSLIPSIADSLNSDLLLSLFLLTQTLTTHYLTHFIFFRLDTPLELFWLPNGLSVIIGFSLYSLRSHLTENTYIAYQCMPSIVAYSLQRVYLATGCLPRICLPGKVFIAPLPSNGSIRHNVKRVTLEMCTETVVDLYVKQQLFLSDFNPNLNQKIQCK
jgi:hypothetical protein